MKKRIWRNSKEAELDWQRLEAVYLKHHNVKYYSLKEELLEEISRYDYTKKHMNIIACIMQTTRCSDHKYSQMFSDLMVRYPSLMNHKDLDGNTPLNTFFAIIKNNIELAITLKSFFNFALALGHNIKHGIDQNTFEDAILRFFQHIKGIYIEILASTILGYAEEIEFELKVWLPFNIALKSGKFNKEQREEREVNEEEKKVHELSNHDKDAQNSEVLQSVEVNYEFLKIFQGYCFDKSRKLWKNLTLTLREFHSLAGISTPKLKGMALLSEIAQYKMNSYPISICVMHTAGYLQNTLNWGAVQFLVKFLIFQNKTYEYCNGKGVSSISFAAKEYARCIVLLA